MSPDADLKGMLKDALKDLKNQAKFLKLWGWTKKEGSHTIWISPKGEEYSHDIGLFGEHTRAFPKAQNDIVRTSFVQFQIQVFADKSVEGHCIPSYSEEPIDWFFPCVKDGKLYWYDDAVCIACYNVEASYDLDRWLALKKVIENNFNLDKIQMDDIIEVVEYYREPMGKYEFGVI